MSPGQSERQFFVDIERRSRSVRDLTGYVWELHEGKADKAHLVIDYAEIRTRGGTVTLWGARRCARRAKRRVLKMDASRYLPREAV